MIYEIAYYGTLGNLKKKRKGVGLCMFRLGKFSMIYVGEKSDINQVIA